MRTSDLAGLIGRRLQAHVLVFNVGHSWTGADGHLRTPPEIASTQEVGAVVHNIGWASRNKDPEAELLVLSANDLDAFLDGWSMYDVDLLDAPREPNTDALEALVLAVNTWSATDPPLLTSITDSQVCAHVHDDCYFYLETRHEELPAVVLGGLFGTYVGAALLREPDSDTVEVALPPADLVAELLRRSLTWTGRLVSGLPQQVAVGLATTGWRLGDAVPAPELVVAYDPATSTWTY
jgi:hypothetical protein